MAGYGDRVLAVTMPDVDLTSVQSAVGQAAFSRGTRYARDNAVTHVEWNAASRVLHGVVRGQGGNHYETSAFFTFKRGGGLVLAHGECDCPVGFNCKHVVALVLKAVPDNQRNPPRKGPTWQQSLDSLLSSPSSGAAVPLAIQVTLAGPAQSGSGPLVAARLVRPGRNGWVGAGLGWNKLEDAHYRGEFDRSHLRLLQEIYAIHRARSTDYSGYYAYRDEKTIDLTKIESRHLWPMLDEAEKIGVRLVHGKKQLGDLAKYGSMGLCLDATRGKSAKSLSVTPVLHVDGAPVDVRPIRFIGTDGHGLLYVSAAEAEHPETYLDWHLGLARLDKAVPAQLQKMLMENRRLEIPAGEAARFRDEYYPRLRNAATVISSDLSFTPPEISDPILTLRASYGDGHSLELDWEWVYQVGESRMRVPLDEVTDNAGYRNLDQERVVLAGLDLDFLRSSPGETLAAHQALGGIDTMVFSTEVLPRIVDQPGVAVETTGEMVDYREAGDSVRIGLSTGELAGETDWFDLGVTITVEGNDVPFLDVFTALVADRTHLLLADGAYFSLEKPELRSLRRLIEEARALQDTPGGALRISRFQVGLWDELAELGVVDSQARAWREQVQGLLSVDSLDTTEVPATLAAHLRPYQLTGFRWLAFLWQHRLGGILADDMGLGKTVQALALICHAKQDDPSGAPFLIVAPTSVVSNWATESARFAPGLKVVAISDTMRKRGQDLAEVIAGADVVVTSYTLFRLDFDAYSEQSWAGLILDEAQFVKNHQSKAHQCARMLAAPFKLAITGTPMENNLMELWSLLSITAPGLFATPGRFQDYYARPIEKTGDAELLAQLRRRIKPLVKRRTKEQVAADLPEKQEQVLEVELHPRHRKIYQTHLQRERQKVLGLVDDMNKNRFTILRSLTLLRQLSLHAGLVDDKHHDLPCAKVEALFEQLQDVVDGGHRALVFSQFTGFLKIVRDRLDAAGIGYSYLDGGTRKRGEVVQRFKDGVAPVFLISLKAGGFGLNLTEADYCFLLDPWWNPATEAQAVDRTHRIGQTRNVMVYRLVAKDTIEEKVMALKAKKAELFAGVMDEGNAFGSGLDAEDIRGLFD
jgi:superfamily II DNA or RNA helicase